VLITPQANRKPARLICLFVCFMKGFAGEAYGIIKKSQLTSSRYGHLLSTLEAIIVAIAAVGALNHFEVSTLLA
jgi:hypothetical protein